jgi:hypothetical protein
LTVLLASTMALMIGSAAGIGASFFARKGQSALRLPKSAANP